MLPALLFVLAQFDARGDGGTLAGTTSEVGSGYLLDVRNGPIVRMTLDPAGQLAARYVGASVAFMGNAYWAVSSGGFAFTSARAYSDTSADFMLVTADNRAGPMLEGRAGGYPGTPVWSANADGSLTAGRSGGAGAFIESSGVGDPLGNGGPPAMTCRYGSGGNCYLLLAGREANNGFHGVVTIANNEYRDAGTGLMLQVVSREGRSEAPSAEHGHKTTTTVSDRGDLKLWGGTVAPYFSGSLPDCVSGPDDGRSGPHSGAVAWSQTAGALFVCDPYGEWRQLAVVE